MSKRIRLTPRKRRESIIVAALHLASAKGGWNRLTRAAIAEHAGCSTGCVSGHLGSMDSIRALLVKVAIKQENFDILIQALSAGHPAAEYMKPMLKQKALSHLTGA